MKRVAIIMAGGSGERFWPVSRKALPKQALKLTSETKTMIEESIDRISPLIAPEDVFIITSEVLAQPLRDALKGFPAQNVIPEPYKRNTAPCLALGAAFVSAKYPDLSADQISVAVLTADQSITPESAFVETVDAALSYSEINSAITTIGIPASRPETGYGYVEIEQAFSKPGVCEVAPSLGFREKPNYEQACEFVKKGSFLWNSGMFFFRLDVFVNGLKEALPEVGDKIAIMAQNLIGKTSESFASLKSVIGAQFEAMPNISIDYGLMEKAKNVAVAKALFEWDDVGAWDSLDRIREKDATGNISKGSVSLIDTKNSIVINETDKKIIVACNGLDEMIVVVTDDAIMICPKSKAQDIKKNVEDIRANFGEDRL